MPRIRRTPAAAVLGAARRPAEVLEERGDVEGAVAAYRTVCAKPEGLWNVAVPLARILARHGRDNEAIEVMRELAEEPDELEERAIDFLCTLYADHGRPQEGLALLDAIEERRGREEWPFFRMRLPLVTACGRPDEAIEQAVAHPESNARYAADEIAGMLTAAGPPDEARAILEPHITSSGARLAQHLVEAGRITDAITALQQQPKEWTDGPWTATSLT